MSDTFREFALGGPPTEKEIDAWEASKPAGHWDYWDFLKFYIIPGHGKKFDTLVIYFAANTIFDQPMEKIGHLKIPHIGHYALNKTIKEKLLTYCSSIVCNEDCHWPDDDHFEKIVCEVRYGQIFAAFQKRYGMCQLDGLTWTDGNTKFNTSFPDQ